MTKDDPWVTQYDPLVTVDDPWVTQDDPWVTQDDPWVGPPEKLILQRILYLRPILQSNNFPDTEDSFIPPYRFFSQGVQQLAHFLAAFSKNIHL